MNNGRTWTFVADMNADGAITISDVWMWLKWLYFYPGDLVLAAFEGHPATARFFELSPDNYGGGASGFFSFFGWLIILVIASIVVEDIKK